MEEKKEDLPVPVGPVRDEPPERRQAHPGVGTPDANYDVVPGAGTPDAPAPGHIDVDDESGRSTTPGPWNKPMTEGKP